MIKKSWTLDNIVGWIAYITVITNKNFTNFEVNYFQIKIIVIQTTICVKRTYKTDLNREEITNEFRKFGNKNKYLF